MQNPQAITTRELMKAIQAESVPRLRRILLEVLEARQKSSVASPRQNSLLTSPIDIADSGNGAIISTEGSQLSDDADIAALIRHELSGPIGWIRLAAADEISSFESSKTNDAIRKLQRRIDGLVAMIKAGEPLRIQRLSVPHILSDNWQYPATCLSMEPAEDTSSIEIDTDEGLFALMLSNIFQNAMDAATDAVEVPLVHVAWGYTERNYWVRVTNSFKGDRLSLDDVAPVGSSSKKAHEGRGLALIRAVAERLGLTISLEGASGIASFTFSGERVR